jgi:hypothetical protein
MKAVREKWTDERLDDLNDRVSEGFRRIDDEFRALRGEMNARFDVMDAKMDAKFEAMQKLMIQLFAGMIGTFLTATAVLVATQL